MDDETSWGLTVFGEQPVSPVLDPENAHAPGFLPAGILDQGLWWVTRNGECHLLTDLPREHRANVIACPSR